MNQDEQIDTYHHSRLIPAMTDFLEQGRFGWHITANFNRPVSYVAGRDKLKTWSSFVDRCLLGRRYYRKPADQRLFFVAVPEVGLSSGYLHFHLLARLPEERATRFESIAMAAWVDLNRAGSLFVQRIEDEPGSLRRVIGYDLKQARRPNQYAQIILSTEFHHD
jgi:hypothetical protein